MKKESDPQPATLFFGVTNYEELFYFEELKSLQTAMPSLDVQVAVVNATEANGVAKGTVIDLMAPSSRSCAASRTSISAGRPA